MGNTRGISVPPRSEGDTVPATLVTGLQPTFQAAALKHSPPAPLYGWHPGGHGRPAPALTPSTRGGVGREQVVSMVSGSSRGSRAYWVDVGPEG